MSCTHPRCWQWRSPAQGQCFLGPSSWASHDNSSSRWLEAPKQRSRSMGLAKQTGKRRAERTKKNTQIRFLNVENHWAAHAAYSVCCTVPLWKAQQRSGLQSVWYWQVLPASPFVAFWLHWPHTHSCSPQHSWSLVQDWKNRNNGSHILNISAMHSSNANYFYNTGVLKVTAMREHGTHLHFHKAETHRSIDDINDSPRVKSAVFLVKYKWDQRVNWSLIAVRQVPTLTYRLWIVNVGIRRTVFWLFPCRVFQYSVFDETQILSSEYLLSRHTVPLFGRLPVSSYLCIAFYSATQRPINPMMAPQNQQ